MQSLSGMDVMRVYLTDRHTLFIYLAWKMPLRGSLEDEWNGMESSYLR